MFLHHEARIEENGLVLKMTAYDLDTKLIESKKQTAIAQYLFHESVI